MADASPRFDFLSFLVASSRSSSTSVSSSEKDRELDLPHLSPLLFLRIGTRSKMFRNATCQSHD